MEIYIGTILKIPNAEYIRTVKYDKCLTCTATRNTPFCPICGSKTTNIEIKETRRYTTYDIVTDDNYQGLRNSKWEEYLIIGLNVDSLYSSYVYEDTAENGLSLVPERPTAGVEIELWQPIIDVCNNLGLAYAIDYAVVRY